MKAGNRIAVRVWKMVYVPLIRRAAHQILKGRLLDRQVPEKGRWLASDVKAYLHQTWVRTDALMPIARLDELPDFGNRHNVFLASVTTAAYQIMLERSVPAEYAKILVADLAWKIYSWIMMTATLPFRMTLHNPGKRMEKIVRAMITFLFSAPGPPGYEVKVWTEGNNTHTHWTHCPPQTFVRRVIEAHGDRGELDAFYLSWCHYDWAGADILANDGHRGHYTRTQTLSKGEPVCDMCWHGCPKTERKPLENSTGPD